MFGSEVSADSDSITVVVTTDYPVENVMIWADGELVVQSFDWQADPPFHGHDWQIDGDTLTVTIDRAIFPGEAGAAEITVSVWPQSDLTNGGYSVSPVTLDGTPSPFVLPDTPSGQVLTTPTVRSIFNSDPISVVEADNVAAAFATAGINAVESQIFNNPADSGATTIEEWRTSMAGVQAACNWCVANEFNLLGNGDNFGRFGYQLDWMHTNPLAEQVTRETAQMLTDCGCCVGVEMIDEVGNDPPGYDLYDFIDWWHDQGGPPLAWPNQEPYLWETAELSDYSSRYWASGIWRPAMEGRHYSGWEIWYAMTHTNDPPTARPLSGLVSVCGPFYQKRAHGSEYLPGYDELIAGDVLPRQIVLQVWTALAYGASRLRAYAYDWLGWRLARANQTPGEDNPAGLQTGAKPGDDRWAALSVAYNSVAIREEALAGTPYVPVKSGPWVFGRRGSLVWGVNTSERDLASPNGSGEIITPAGETFGSTVPAGGVILWTL